MSATGAAGLIQQMSATTSAMAQPRGGSMQTRQRATARCGPAGLAPRGARAREGPTLRGLGRGARVGGRRSVGGEAVDVGLDAEVRRVGVALGVEDVHGIGLALGDAELGGGRVEADGAV